MRRLSINTWRKQIPKIIALASNLFLLSKFSVLARNWWVGKCQKMEKPFQPSYVIQFKVLYCKKETDHDHASF